MSEYMFRCAYRELKGIRIKAQCIEQTKMFTEAKSKSLIMGNLVGGFVWT